MQTKFRSCIWFSGNAQEAAEYYTDVFPNAGVLDIKYYTEPQPEFNAHMVGEVMIVAWHLGEQQFLSINAGPEFPHSENFSIEVFCDDQEEVDRYWNRLVGDGGEESMCGWCKDKFGLSWQIVPKRFYELLDDPETEVAVTQAMYKMKKFNIADLESAAKAAKS
jgi:predicted 3-demethylubiquinone-9 3-methyltransferase (glyoxalase superfamily)